MYEHDDETTCQYSKLSERANCRNVQKLVDQEESSWLCIIPCFISMMALISGMMSLRCALDNDGDVSDTLMFLTLACICDGLDGCVARRLGATTQFGAELDSLCDLANFGIIPAFIVYEFSMRMTVNNIVGLNTHLHLVDFDKTLTWGVCMFYSLCCCLRLARFNVKDKYNSTNISNNNNAVDKGSTKTDVKQGQNGVSFPVFFEGLPAPMGAAYVLFPIVASMLCTDQIQDKTVMLSRTTVVFQTFFASLLMVSTIPTVSSKQLTYVLSLFPFPGKVTSMAVIVVIGYFLTECSVFVAGCISSAPDPLALSARSILLECTIRLLTGGVILHILTVPISIIASYCA